MKVVVSGHPTSCQNGIDPHRATAAGQRQYWGSLQPQFHNHSVPDHDFGRSGSNKYCFRGDNQLFGSSPETTTSSLDVRQNIPKFSKTPRFDHLQTPISRLRLTVVIYRTAVPSRCSNPLISMNDYLPIGRNINHYD